MERWSGKVAIVTGGTSGIGLKIVEQLQKNGLKVAVFGRRISEQNELEEQLRSGAGVAVAGGTIKGLRCDVTDENDVRTAISWIENNWGSISILVNCAGVFVSNPLIGGSAEAVTNIFSTNVFGITNCVREVVASIRKFEVQDAHIININSICGHHIMISPTIGAHTASKFAVTAITESLKNEIALKKMPIKVTSISPGLVCTEMVAGIKSLEKLPKLKPEDVANCVIFALSTPKHVQITELTVQPAGEILTQF